MSYFGQLPNELKVVVFTKLPTFKDVSSLALAAHDFYQVFVADEAEITRQVLQNQIPPCVLEEAIALWEAKYDQTTRWTWSETAPFFAQYHSRATDYIRACDRYEIRDLLELHETIEKFTDKIAITTLSNAASHFTDAGGLPQDFPSPTERIRIQQALYRFELYFAMFGDPTRRSVQAHDGEREAFWKHFAPWEIEQIAIVYEIIWQAMTEVAERLILTNGPWIEAAWDMYLWHLDLFFRPYNQLHMARGLRHVHNFLLLREDAIVMDRDDFNGHYQGFESIHDGLTYAINQEEHRTIQELENEVPGSAKGSLSTPFVRDFDPGPERAWRWAHRDSTPNFCVFSHVAKPMRSCGYVFWDQERLQRWHMFDHPCEPPSLEHELEQQSQIEEKLEIRYKEAARKYADETYGRGRLCFIDW